MDARSPRQPDALVSTDDAVAPALTGERNPSRERIGVVLINLGTPDAPTPRAVRRYLREFLSDPRVIDISAPARWLLLNAIILPFRPRRSAHAYAQIWTDAGSPLLIHTTKLAEELERSLGPRFVVRVAMRYGSPSIESALDGLRAARTSQIVAVPLFPQYASASTGTALDKLYRIAGRALTVPHVRVAPPFYAHEGFVRATAAIAAPILAARGPEHVVMSYHGLPERQVTAADETQRYCLAREDCCAAIGESNHMCYRAQCFATSRAIAAALRLAPGSYTVAFQSRLGRTPWIGPATDEVIVQLAGRGVRKLAVLCPSFVSDCLETLEEIGLRGREQWLAAGGEELTLVPCVNAHPEWVAGLSRIVRELVAEPDRPAGTVPRAAAWSEPSSNGRSASPAAPAAAQRVLSRPVPERS